VESSAKRIAGSEPVAPGLQMFHPPSQEVPAAEVIQHSNVSDDVELDVRQVLRQNAGHLAPDGTPNRTRNPDFEDCQSLAGSKVERVSFLDLFSIRIEEVEDALLHSSMSGLGGITFGRLPEDSSEA